MKKGKRRYPYLAGMLAVMALCMGGCGESSKTLVFAPEPAPSVTAVPGAPLAYEVTRIDQPKLENDQTQTLGYATYSWLTSGEHTLLRRAQDLQDNQVVYSKLDYRYGFHETLFTTRTTFYSAEVAPDGKHYLTVEPNETEDTLYVVMYESGQQPGKTLLTMDKDAWYNIVMIQWSPDSSVCMLFMSQNEDEEPIAFQASAGTQGEAPAATPVPTPVRSSVIVCSTDACLTPQPVTVSTGINQSLQAVHMSADGRRLLLEQTDWDTDDQSHVMAVRLSEDYRQVERSVELQIPALDTAVFLDDDQFVYVQRYRLKRMTDLWGTPQDRMLQTLQTNASDSIAYAFAPNGQALAYASYDKTGNWNVYILSVGTDGTTTDRLVYKGSTDPLMEMSFSPEGGRLLLQTAGHRQGDGRQVVILTFE